MGQRRRSKRRAGPCPTTPQKPASGTASSLENQGEVVVWPRDPSARVDGRSKADFFDSLFHSAAVVGINTSALIKAGILRRPVLAVFDPECRASQEGTSFQYLVEASGGLLQVAHDLDEHVAQLRTALVKGGHDERARAFVESFIRPCGVERGDADPGRRDSGSSTMPTRPDKAPALALVSPQRCSRWPCSHEPPRGRASDPDNRLLALEACPTPAPFHLPWGPSDPHGPVSGRGGACACYRFPLSSAKGRGQEEGQIRRGRSMSARPALVVPHGFTARMFLPVDAAARASGADPSTSDIRAARRRLPQLRDELVGDRFSFYPLNDQERPVDVLANFLRLFFADWALTPTRQIREREEWGRNVWRRLLWQAHQRAGRSATLGRAWYAAENRLLPDPYHAAGLKRLEPDVVVTATAGVLVSDIRMIRLARAGRCALGDVHPGLGQPDFEDDCRGAGRTS